jgi:UDPglucose--hexose-1-phosphate uridylyltransferase
MFGVPEHDEKCVLCPGNEHLNLELVRFDKDANIISHNDWEVRVIKNKFASLEHTSVYRHRDFYVSHSGDGDHEVIITRKHNEPVALQSISTVELSLKIFMERMKELAKHPELAYVQIFHNHGRDAGASLIHPHYQLMATPIIPPHIHDEIMGCQHYYHIHKSDIYGDILKEEMHLKERIVHESEHFVVLSAYASRKPFETWIIPKRQCARFEDMTEEELKHLSFLLKVMLGQEFGDTKFEDCPKYLGVIASLVNERKPKVFSYGRLHLQYICCPIQRCRKN